MLPFEYLENFKYFETKTIYGIRLSFNKDAGFNCYDLDKEKYYYIGNDILVEEG